MGFFDDVFDFVGDIFEDIVEWFVDIPDVPDYEDKSQGTLLNKQSNLAPIPVVYGERKVGGTRVFVETSGTDNTYLYICLVLSEGEISGIKEIYVNDKLSSTIGGLSTHGQTINATGDIGGYATFQAFHGTDDQVASSLLTTAPSWTANHRLRGVAYLACKFTWNRDLFGSIPDVTVVLKGKKVYDPRDATTGYSTNPSLCLLDYLTNSRYGKNLPSSAFESDYASWKSAADFCESNVTDYTGGSSINIYDCHAVIDVSKTIIDNVKILLSGMQGQLVYSQGVYKLIPENDYTASYAFNEDNILSNITIVGEKRKDKYNRVIATFTNPDKEWQQDQIEYPEAGSSEYTSLLAEDSGFELETRMSLETITNVYQARNAAYTLLYRSRSQLKCSFLATVDALQVAVGDIVNVTHSSLGWSAKKFRVIGLSLQQDGNVGVSLYEHDATIYAWNEGVEVEQPAATTLPDPFTVGAVSESTISVASSEAINDNGSSYQRFVISWTEPNDNFISEYIVQLKESDSTDWKIQARSDEPPVYINSIVSGVDYNIRIKSVNSLGVASAWVYAIDEASTSESACNTAGGTWDGTRCLINFTASNLTTAAGGGNTTYYQDNAPTSDLETGDLWIDTNDSNKISRYNGTSWDGVTGAVASIDSVTEDEISLTNDKLADITSDLGAITAGSLSINNLFTVDSSGNCTIKNAATGARLEIKNNVIKVYDASNVVRVQIGDLS
jgi:hypothetical protein